jgi:hypothetical protein
VTAASLKTGRLDVSAVATAIIDTKPLAPSAGPAAPPVLLLHGSGPDRGGSLSRGGRGYA